MKGLNSRAFRVCAAALMVVFVGSQVRASDAPKKTHSVAGWTFQGPEFGVHISKAGVGVHSINLVAKASGKFAWITLHQADRDEVEGLPADKRLQTLKAVFLGATGPAKETVERTILGKKVTGDRQRSTIPRPLTLEAYLVPLPDGGALFVGFRWFDSAPVAVSEKFFADFAATLAPEKPE